MKDRACISSIVCTPITLKYFNELMVLVVYEKKKCWRLDSLESIYEASLYPRLSQSNVFIYSP